VICAPIYGEALGLRTEVVVGPADGRPADSAIRCDFLSLMFKRSLTGFVSTLSAPRQGELPACPRERVAARLIFH
jgi:hypothetical protein